MSITFLDFSYFVTKKYQNYLTEWIEFKHNQFINFHF